MMQPIIIRLPDEDRRLLELEARQEGVVMAEIVRLAIKTYLKRKPKKPHAAEILLKWALRKDKKYKSSFKDKDLSANYKDYLYGPKSPKFGYLWKKQK